MRTLYPDPPLPSTLTLYPLPLQKKTGRKLQLPSRHMYHVPRLVAVAFVYLFGNLGYHRFGYQQ